MRFLVAAAIVILLSACGPRMVQTDVTRFSAAPSGPGAGTVTILPGPDQRGSLEFQAYAEMVAEELRALGFTPVPADARPAADYEVRLDWGVGDAVTEIRSSPTTVFGGTSVFGSRRGYGIGVGVPLGDPVRVDSDTTFPKWLRVTMRPGGAPGSAAEATNVFEARAVTGGRGPSIQPAMPYLVDAVFADFPGRSGVTERVRIPARP